MLKIPELISKNKCELFSQYDVFLVDASGVLYSDDGLVSGAKVFFDWAKKNNKNVFLCTNNTSQSPSDISGRLMNMGLRIPASQIISSGLGLWLNKDIRAMLVNKNVYVYGYNSSKFYVNQAGAEIVNHPDKAHVIVLLASLKNSNEEVYSNVLKTLRKKPYVKLICANPDRYVAVRGKKVPVIGYYAEKLQKELDRDIIWIGKPEANFSEVVKAFLFRFNKIELDKHCCFLDDNIENILAMQRHIGVSGIFVKDTGLGQLMDYEGICKQNKQVPDAIIDSLGV